MPSRSFSDRIVSQCRAAFVDKGFDSPRKGTILYPIDDNFFGWVGLNRGVRRDALRLNPFVGIHARSLELQYCDYHSSKYKKGDIATYAVHLGELAPEVDQFIFEPGGTSGLEVRRLIDTVMAFGIPWMRSIGNYERLARLLEERVTGLGGVPERYAIALLRSGKKFEAIDFVSKFAANVDCKHPGYKEHFVPFANAFLRKNAN